VASDARETFEKCLNRTSTNLGQLKHECVNFTNSDMVEVLYTFCTTLSSYSFILQYKSSKKRLYISTLLICFDKQQHALRENGELLSPETDDD
jgi:hypothetical protein